MSFTEIWTVIRETLYAGAHITNWTQKKGVTGTPFDIISVADDFVLVEAPNTKVGQIKVPRRDFENVYERWDDYIHGNFRRDDFTPLTFYSKYIISILHWLEQRPEVSKNIDGSGEAARTNAIVAEDDESAFLEGKAKFGLHRRLERDRAIVRKAKAKRLAETGLLACEVCDTDFETVYGEVGVGFIEAHHKMPVASLDGTEKTKISDLALVCSNCHRMLHRAKPLLSVGDLKKLYRERK